MVDSDHVEIGYSLRLMTSLFTNVYKCNVMMTSSAAMNKDLQSPDRTQPIHNIIQRLIINNNQLFNIRQQQYYCVIDELKCHN